VKSRRTRLAGHVVGIAGYWEPTYIGYWWESQKEKIPVGRARNVWIDNIKMDLGAVEWAVID
jgi:hypothetical protein